MRVPQRKSEKNYRAGSDADRYLSHAAIENLRSEIERMSRSRPRLVEELARAREMGDLSENAAYSDAKRRLTGLDLRIANLEDRIKNAIIIELGTTGGKARIGSIVTVESVGKRRQFEITGSQESDPANGRISHLCPIGKALLGHGVGETVRVTSLNGKTSEYVIIEVT